MSDLIATSPATNLVEYTVSELAFALKRTVEEAYGLVRLRGEISGFRGQHSSGHCYFTLKDEKACIEAVIWRSTFQRLKFKPEQGLEVVVKGRITTYPGKSKYQIVIDDLEPAGIGALMALLEQRKQMLAAEGLFDEARKRPLPYLPRIVGVVTSPTGAVIRDILHRLYDRFPCHVLVWPVRVQGETCAVEVSAAIGGFNALDPRRRGAATRSHHRRPRRRQPRGSLGLQRGGRGPRRGREHHSADLGGRARDRLDHHRPRRRLARADADRRRRARRSGPRRAPHPGDELRLARRELPQAADGGAAQSAAGLHPRACRARPTFWRCRASASTAPRPGCRARSTPMPTRIASGSSARPRASARIFCAARRRRGAIA